MKVCFLQGMEEGEGEGEGVLAAGRVHLTKTTAFGYRILLDSIRFM